MSSKIDPISEFVGKTAAALEVMAKSLELIHKRIDDHMENEEKEQRATSERLAAIEKKYEFFVWTAKWVVPALLFIWPILAPIAQDWFARKFGLDPSALLTLNDIVTYASAAI